MRLRILLLLALLVLLAPPAARGQEPSPPEPTPVGSSPSAPAATPSPLSSPSAPSVVPAVLAPQPRQSTLVRVRTLPLFTIAGTDSLPAEERGRLVEARVREVIRRHGEDLPPMRVALAAGSTVVLAGDQVLITVLPADLPEFDLRTVSAEERRLLEAEVAERWREALQTELVRAAVMETPAWRRFALSLAALFLVLAYLLHRLAGWLGRTWLHSPAWSLKFGVWSVAITACLWLFPESQAWARAVYEGVLHPFLLLWAVILGATAVSYAVEALIHRYFVALQREQEDLFLNRLSQRVATLDQAARVTARVALMIVAALVYISLLNIDLRPILTGAGIMGVALGLAMQDFLKDVVAGVNVLMEDQFGVGDVIEVDGMAGTVEAFTLRATRIRTVDGRMISLPNTTLRVVQNHSNGWSRVDFKVRISFGDDLEKALGLLKEEADRLAEEWDDRILEPPVMLGVDSLGDSGPVLRILLQTRPLSQWETGRELNRRVKLRFDREGITIPYPQRVVRMAREEANHES